MSNSAPIDGSNDFAGLVFVMVGALVTSGSGDPFHLTLPGGLFAIAGVNIGKSAGSSARKTSSLIDGRFISAGSGFELDLSIAASGGYSAGPVPRAHFSPNGRFVETSGDVIKRVLSKKSLARQHYFFRQHISLDQGDPGGVILGSIQ